MKPLIGIPCRRWKNEKEPWWPHHDGIIVTAIDAVVRGGGVPLMIPIVDDTAVVKQLYEQVHGVMMVGGGDMEPRFYGADPHPKQVNVNIPIDRMELTIASWTMLDQKPLFGICRGIQVMNVAFGGSLMQDILTTIDTKIDHDESANRHDPSLPIHDLELVANSRLAGLLGTRLLKVNTMHHMALDRVASDLRVVGRSPDGIIEAVEGRNAQYVLGVQSHPEAVAAQDERWQKVFRDFCEASGAFSRRERKTKLTV